MKLNSASALAIRTAFSRTHLRWRKLRTRRSEIIGHSRFQNAVRRLAGGWGTGRDRRTGRRCSRRRQGSEARLGWFHWFAISAFAATSIFYSAILANYVAFMGYWLAACFYFRCTQGGFEK